MSKKLSAMILMTDARSFGLCQHKCRDDELISDIPAIHR